MSYTEYLRTKLAAQQKVTAISKPTDASHYTQKQRMSATRVGFFADGGSVGSLVKSTDRPVFNNATVSSKKPTGRSAPASDFTVYKGSGSSWYDLDLQAKSPGLAKRLVCVDPNISPPTPLDWTYPNASNFTKSKVSCPAERGDAISDIQFRDNTISLSAMHPDMVSKEGDSRTCDIAVPNHIHSPGIQVDVNNQPYAVGKPYFMATPPEPEGPNVSPNKVGGYVGVRTPYVENKHGYAQPTKPVPQAPGGQGQEIAHLKINKPTLFKIHS
jgi:hypothetical protein